MCFPSENTCKRRPTRLCRKTPSGWLGHSEAVPQEAALWGFASLSRQPPGLLDEFSDKAERSILVYILHYVKLCTVVRQTATKYLHNRYKTYSVYLGWA